MERAEIKIRGIVQGVGFRPFIHKFAGGLGLKGFIKNTSSGVELELEGEREKLELFVRELPDKAPRLALIESVEAKYSPELVGYKSFEIRESRREESMNTLISPDICVCGDCLRELRDRGDRRYKYPFINCTNCGPRFTIIKDVPYDRAKTSMGAFPMCPDCAREYGDIEDRRYHAQPDCCPDCGPRVFLLDADGKEQEGDGIELARSCLKKGGIVAVKGLGGMHLACRWDLPDTVNALRRRKHRDERPFALMCRDLEAAKKLCLVSPEEEKILSGWQRPIVLLKKRGPGLEHLSENDSLGLMLPYTPLHYLLFGDDIDVLVMTSANLSDQPIIYKNQEALEKLRGVADAFLLHDREIQTRCDDSLCWVYGGREYFARRSRGYVPFPIKIDGCRRRILACGAEQKASFCLSKAGYIFQSQHIGDLKNLETLENYQQQAEHFQKLFDIKPELICCDMHPDYLSTAYAQERAREEGLPLVMVQHHHAHMAACMADNGLDGPVIGLIWDGVGHGLDGNAWGGECLAGDFRGFRRLGSLLPIAMPGGDRAVKETDRLAFSLMREAGCLREVRADFESYEKLLLSGMNCPRSSGMGRLFDGVAAILGIKERCGYEGQGAVLLESAAERGEEGLYSLAFEEDPLLFDWRPMIREITRDKERGISRGLIAARFMNSLVMMALEQAIRAGRDTGIKDVVLSGGSFQNMYIMSRLPGLLEKAGFRVFWHRRVSANDEGLALGQLMVAQSALEEGRI